MNPVRSLARAKGASPEDLGGATSYGMNKKLLVTLTALSVAFVAFLSGYLISQKGFYRSHDPSSIGSLLNKFSGKSFDSSVTNKSASFRLLSPRRVLSPIMSKEKDSVIYYEKDTGKVFEVYLKDLKEKLIADNPLSDLIKTIWSPSRKEVVSLFYYPDGIHYKYFDLKTKNFADLGTSIKSLVFSPDGNRIAYFGTQDKSKGIFISQSDGSSSKNIFPNRFGDAEVYWPLDDLLYFKVDSLDGSELYSLTKTGEITKVLDLPSRSEVNLSKDGSRVLFSKDGDLFYKDLSSPEDGTTLNTKTPAYKCTWEIDDRVVVCGIPKLSSSGDDLYEIGLDGTKKLLFSPNFPLETAGLFLSGLSDQVVVLNALDNKLYILNK